MDIVTLLEQLANKTQFDIKKNLVAILPENIKQSFVRNDAESLKQQLSIPNECVANEIDVVEIHL